MHMMLITKVIKFIDFLLSSSDIRSVTYKNRLVNSFFGFFHIFFYFFCVVKQLTPVVTPAALEIDLTLRRRSARHRYLQFGQKFPLTVGVVIVYEIKLHPVSDWRKVLAFGIIKELFPLHLHLLIAAFYGHRKIFSCGKLAVKFFSGAYYVERRLVASVAAALQVFSVYEGADFAVSYYI